MLKTVLLSSLDLVFPDKCPEAFCGKLSAFANEPLSFQLAYKSEDEAARVNIAVKSDLPVNIYAVKNTNVTNFGAVTDFAEGHIYPDMLFPYNYKGKIVNHPYPWAPFYIQEDNDTALCAYVNEWSALWLCVNEEGKKLKSGTYPLSITFYNQQNSVIGEFKTKIVIMEKSLPPQSLTVTNWLHCDCLADYYETELFSDRFFDILKNYLKAASINGMNMVLTPAFTPPLDIGIGHCRMKAQLVKVKVTESGYEFDFDLLEKFIDASKSAGIKYFEHSHLFSQWGAKHAPAIYADVKGKNGKYAEKRIFGWETNSSGRKYLDFIRQYMTAFRKFAERKKIVSKTLIHISDEPFTHLGDYYEKAYDAISDLLCGFMQGDALSEISYVERGYVKNPIVVTNEIDKFYGKCRHLWAYYTGGQVGDGLSNRVVGYAPYKNRAIGYQLYKYNIEGFLSWGYNYWYGTMSRCFNDPKSDANTFGMGGSGGAFIVYPGRKGSAIQSIRQKVFGEGVSDLRALTLLEKEKGREAAEKLLKKHFGEVTFRTLPESEEALRAFRDELNKKIMSK